IADVCELPVEDTPQAFRADHEVADAEISMQQHRRVARRGVRPEPAQTQVQDGVWLAESFKLGGSPREGGLRRRLIGRWSGKEVEPCLVRVDAVNAGQLLSHLSRQSASGFGQACLAHDAPAYRLAFETIHEKKRHTEDR